MKLKKKIIIVLSIMITLAVFFDNVRAETYSNKLVATQNKVAFLTFDDGPCINNTKKITDILKSNNIKATFFIVGQKAEENPEAMKILVNNEMCLMPHTYSHDYNIYKTVDGYFNDLNKCMEVIKKYQPNKNLIYTRIPGGSDNPMSNKSILSHIRKGIISRGMNYVDWNISTGDATAHYVPGEKIIGNLRKQCQDQKIVVVLMHDTYYKKTTVETLPQVIKYLKDKGYTFKTFNDITENEKNELIRIKVINRKQGMD